MIYDSASLQGVPWEIIIKSYRNYLGSKSHDHLNGYAQDFFDFIAGHTLLFPQDVLERQFIELADRAAADILLPIFYSESYKEEPDDGKKADMMMAGILAREIAAEDVTLIPNAANEDVENAQAKYKDVVTKAFNVDELYKYIVPEMHMERLAKIAIRGLYCSDFSHRNSTGLVFAGYGNKDFFPRIEQYLCYGLLAGKSYCDLEKTITISHDNASDALPLAKSDMITTFILGQSLTAMADVHAIFQARLDEIEKQLKKAKLLDQNAAMSAIRQGAEKAFRQGVVDYFYDKHQRPLRRVIANLPIDELAELAETLVRIESLKERVTTPEESVSGPIDVAVIFKHDGFIWIKRKNYFKAELNPRFLLNQPRAE
jgi:hypothetical protein